MPCELLRLTWADFDRAVEDLASDVPAFCKAIYGQPRGGLPLAVALSHRTGLPLVQELGDDVLWVDDIADTGATVFRVAMEHPGVVCATWVSRRGHLGVLSSLIVNDDRWILFPWEQEIRAEADKHEYEAKR